MPAIELRDVHKRFFIPHEKHTTLTERLLASFRPRTYERFEALRGVDFVVEKGSAVGVIGGNGSGKSTLLKIISGLLPPDRGTVSVDGSLSALLELGLGFNNELTVRENVELYAAVLGYPRREVHRRVDAAIDFADLERFRDAKLKNLSTGMRARLGFATALQAESDILLLDEILAVGDADFQLKCLNVFETSSAGGARWCW
jgi:lipopolysaccharide transport system ATP-binding protein